VNHSLKIDTSAQSFSEPFTENSTNLPDWPKKLPFLTLLWWQPQKQNTCGIKNIIYDHEKCGRFPPYAGRHVPHLKCVSLTRDAQVRLGIGSVETLHRTNRTNRRSVWNIRQ